MVKANLSNEMKNMLKSLIGTEFISYEGEDRLKEKIINTYGNCRFNIAGRAFELTNLEKTLLFYDFEDEIAVFELKEVNPKVKFKPYCVTDSTEIKLGEIITDIEVISDFIRVEEFDYEIIFDRAIIFKTEKSVLMFSRDIWFSEMINISMHDDYDAIYTIAEVKDVWSNDGEYNVSVKRTREKL